MDYRKTRVLSIDDSPPLIGKTGITMRGPTSYLNTDLQLMAVDDLRPLATALESLGMIPYTVEQVQDGLWGARLVMVDAYPEPSAAIAAIISIVESLEPGLRAIWSACKSREFDIGYECGDSPTCTIHSLDAALIGRLAAVGGALGVTLYSYADGEE